MRAHWVSEASGFWTWQINISNDNNDNNAEFLMAIEISHASTTTTWMYAHRLVAASSYLGLTVTHMDLHQQHRLSYRLHYSKNEVQCQIASWLRPIKSPRLDLLCYCLHKLTRKIGMRFNPPWFSSAKFASNITCIHSKPSCFTVQYCRLTISLAMRVISFLGMVRQL